MERAGRPVLSDPTMPSFISARSVYPALAARRAASSEAIQCRLVQ